MSQALVARGSRAASRPTFFVDNSAGSDSNNGRSAAAPWQTLSHVNGATLPAGSRVLLKRGGTWREELLPKASVTYSAYSSGSLPAIYGSDQITGLTQEPPATEQSGSLASANFDDGTLNSTTADTSFGGTFSASTDHARSGTFSMKFVGNGTDNRGLRYVTYTAATSGSERHFFLAIWVAAASMKTSSELRIGHFQNGSTAQGFVSLYTDGSGNITQLTVNGNGTNAGGLMINQVAIGSQFTMGAWNTIEIRYVVSATVGGSTAYVNGVQVGTSAYTLNTSGSVGINRLEVGSDSFGTGLVNGGAVYYDDIKVSATAISQQLQGTDNHIWSGSVTTQPLQLYVAGTRGLQVASAAAVTSTGQWYWASNTLTVWAPTTSSTQPVLESSTRAYCVNLGSNNNVVIDSLALMYAGEAGVIGVNTSDQPKVTNCTITGAFIEAVFIGSTTSNMNNGIVSGNTITDCGGTGISLQGQLGGTWIVSGNTVTFCGRLHDQQTGGNARQQFSAGIKIWGAATSGYLGPIQIFNNTVTDCGPQFDAGTSPGVRALGLWLDHIVSPTGRPQVYGNTFARNASTGIFIEKTMNADVHHNLVVNCGTIAFRGGIFVEANNAPTGTASGNKVMNNTVYGGYWPMALNWSGGGQINNNALINNIAYGGANPQQFNVASGANNDGTNSTGNTIDHCNFGPNASNMINWGGTQYSTVAAFQTAVAAATNGVTGDPLLTNPPTDCTLQSGSPCVNAGATISGITDGFLGAAPDLGYAEKA